MQFKEIGDKLDNWSDEHESLAALMFLPFVAVYFGILFIVLILVSFVIAICFGNETGTEFYRQVGPYLMIFAVPTLILLIVFGSAPKQKVVKSMSPEKS